MTYQPVSSAARQAWIDGVDDEKELREIDRQAEYRCPECDTSSGTFTECKAAEGDEVLDVIHSYCGRAGTPEVFTPGTPEFERVYQGDEEEGEYDEEYHLIDSSDPVERARELILEYAPQVSVGFDIRPFFAEGHEMTPDEVETVEACMTDILADLKHFSARYGVDFTGALRLANIHHSAEV